MLSVKCLSPFLRCVAMCLCYLNLLTPPAELTDGATGWSMLCTALSLPDRLCEMFSADGSSLEPQAQKWIQKLLGDKAKFGLDFGAISFPAHVAIPDLAPLPKDFRKVIEATNDFCCKHKKRNTDDVLEANSSPAMCLICGKTICCLAKCCNRASKTHFTLAK